MSHLWLYLTGFVTIPFFYKVFPEWTSKQLESESFFVLSTCSVWHSDLGNNSNRPTSRRGSKKERGGVSHLDAAVSDRGFFVAHKIPQLTEVFCEPSLAYWLCRTRGAGCHF